MNFEVLVNTIQTTHNQLQLNAIKSMNKHLTIRNWLIGFYIVEFEQNGADRAQYGEKLLDELADSIKLKGLGFQNLKLFCQFYFQYPQIGTIMPGQLIELGVNSELNLLNKDLQQDDSQFFTIGAVNNCTIKRAFIN